MRISRVSAKKMWKSHKKYRVNSRSLVLIYIEYTCSASSRFYSRVQWMRVNKLVFSFILFFPFFGGYTQLFSQNQLQLEIYLTYRRPQVLVYVCFIGIPIDGVTSPSGGNEHKFIFIIFWTFLPKISKIPFQFSQNNSQFLYCYEFFYKDLQFRLLKILGNQNLIFH